MADTIIIENLTGRHIQYRIEHQLVCVKTGKCLCKQGRRGTVASSIHVAGGVGRKTDPLPAAVTLLPQVKADAKGPKPRIKIHGSKTTAEEAKQATKAAKQAAKDAKAKAKAQDSDKPSKRGGRGGRKGNK